MADVVREIASGGGVGAWDERGVRRGCGEGASCPCWQPTSIGEW